MHFHHFGVVACQLFGNPRQHVGIHIQLILPAQVLMGFPILHLALLAAIPLQVAPTTLVEVSLHRLLIVAEAANLKAAITSVGVLVGFLTPTQVVLNALKMVSSDTSLNR